MTTAFHRIAAVVAFQGGRTQWCVGVESNVTELQADVK